jgi:integrase
MDDGLRTEGGGIMSGRIKTNYPGVFYREVERIGGPGTEKVFYVVFKKDGKVNEEKVGRQFVDDMTPARAARIRAERIEGKRPSRKEIREQEEAKQKAEQNRWTIVRLWEEYKRGNPAVKAIRKDEDRFNRYLKDTFGNREPKELVPMDVDRLRINLQKMLKPATVRNALELLRRIVNFGVKKHLCEGLNFTIQMPKVNNLKTEDLTPEQLSRLLKAINEDENLHVANIMRMALFTGMRKTEIFRLQWSHIDFDRGFINIIDPKGGPNQKIPLNDAARQILLDHPRTEGSDYLFPGRDLQSRRNAHKQVNRIKERAGLPKDFRPLHGLRHVYASMLASSGEVDMYTLQKLLTHKSPMMTQRYAHLRDGVLKRASDLAGDLINQVAKGDHEEKALKLL